MLHPEIEYKSKSMLIKNPGPGYYDPQVRPKSGYTMRPKTSYQRDCTFIVIEISLTPRRVSWFQALGDMKAQVVNSKTKV